ncbi:MAG: hypothetical protein GXN99_02180 [Candidatus Nanohaloarchaeota archaeon]|nr:hypothetical protein [Candidatus Nanohaloarchaeota archaeon]
MEENQQYGKIEEVVLSYENPKESRKVEVIATQKGGYVLIDTQTGEGGYTEIRYYKPMNWKDVEEDFLTRVLPSYRPNRNEASLSEITKNELSDGRYVVEAKKGGPCSAVSFFNSEKEAEKYYKKLIQEGVPTKNLPRPTGYNPLRHW